MRLIFTILLIGLFKADAQMVINASAPYRPSSVAGGLLLDNYSGAAAAYSLRKLRTAYTGAAIRVRKDTTGQPEQDVNFIGNELDTASLKSFLNARNGFVVTWYDQSGNSNNATQSTQANQPRIANLGVIERQNTKPTVRFDGSNDNLQGDGAASSISGEDVSWSVLSVVTKADRAGFESTYGFGNSSDVDPLILPLSYADTAYRFFLRPTGTITPVFDARFNSITINTQFLLSNFSSGLAYNFYRNNIFLSGASYNTTTININTATIGALRRTSVIDYLNGNVQELIYYNSDKSTDRTAISNNINNYYGIY